MSPIQVSVGACQLSGDSWQVRVEELEERKLKPMIIEDSELQIKKQANVNGVLCTLSWHPTLETYFVCKDDKVIHIGSKGGVVYAPDNYDRLIERCLNQPRTVVNIVEGSLVEA
jgi:hypothetical protein